MDDQFDSMLYRRVTVFADRVDDSDWLEVRRRAGEPSRSRLLSRGALLAAAALVVVGVLAAPGWGLGSRLVDLFSGEPAPPNVKQAVHESDVGAPPGMAPGIEAGETRRLLTVQLADGRHETLWVAPSRSGGVCEYLQRGPVASPGAGCGPTEIPAGKIYWGLQGHAEHDTTVVLHGRVGGDVASLDLNYADRTTAHLPLTQGFFLYEIPASHFAQGKRPSFLVGNDAGGHEVARALLHPDSLYGVFPGDNRHPPRG
jgi:hypothetical protein